MLPNLIIIGAQKSATPTLPADMPKSQSMPLRLHSLPGALCLITVKLLPMHIYKSASSDTCRTP